MSTVQIDRLKTGIPGLDSYISYLCTEIELACNVTAAPPLQALRTPAGLNLRMAASTFQWAKSKSGGIAAMSGSTPGKADVTLWDFGGTSFVTQNVEVEAFNVGSTAVGATKLILLAMVGKYWFVIWEDCS